MIRQESRGLDRNSRRCLDRIMHRRLPHSRCPVKGQDVTPSARLEPRAEAKRSATPTRRAAPSVSDCRVRAAVEAIAAARWAQRGPHRSDSAGADGDARSAAKSGLDGDGAGLQERRHPRGPLHRAGRRRWGCWLPHGATLPGAKEEAAAMTVAARRGWRGGCRLDHQDSAENSHGGAMRKPHPTRFNRACSSKKKFRTIEIRRSGAS